MSANLKRSSSWKQLLIFLGISIAIFLVLSIVGTMIIASISGITLTDLADSSKWDYKNPQFINVLFGLQLVQFLGLFLIPSLFFGYLSDSRPLSFVGFKKTNNALFYLFGIGLLIVSFPLIEVLGIWNRNIAFPPSVDKWINDKEDSASKVIELMLSRHSVRYLLMNLLFIAGFAAVGEELFFRGVLQRIFIRMFHSPVVGIIVAAFIFSAIHMQFYGFVPRLVLGVFLGLIYWYSGSLWVAIVAHFVYDGGLLVVAYFHPETVKDESGVFATSQLWILFFISLALVFYVIRWMAVNSAAKFSQVYSDDFRPDDPFQS